MAVPVVNVKAELAPDASMMMENARASADMLLKPCGEMLYSLKQRLPNCASPWIQEFLRYHGLTRLLRTLELLSRDREKDEWSSVSDAILQLDCVGCIREVLNFKEGLEYFLQHQELIEKLVLSLDTPNAYPKKQIFEVLSCVAIATTEAHQAVLGALEKYQVLKHQSHRFTLILHELKLAENAHYRTTLMCFVNALISGETELQERARIRNQLIALRLLDVLNFLKKEELDSELCIQVKTFYDSKLKDDHTLKKDYGFQHSDAASLFHALNNKVTGRAEAACFVHILQDLYALKYNSDNASLIWNALEKVTYKITTLQSESDTELFMQNLVNFLRDPSSHAKCSVPKPQEGLNPEKDSHCHETKREESLNKTDDKFSEIDEALKAILRTTEDLQFDQKDQGKDDRRDSGISMRSSICSPLLSRQNSEESSLKRDLSSDLGDDVKVSYRRSSTGVPKTGTLPSISESQTENESNSVFQKAAEFQRSRKSDSTFRRDNSKDEPVKLHKTKFTTLVPALKEKTGPSIWNEAEDRGGRKADIDYLELERHFKDDLQKRLLDPDYEVKLLGEKACVELNLLLARLETSAQYLAASVRQNETENLEIEARRRLLNALPSQEQVDFILEYTKYSSMYDLGQAEQLLIHLAAIPDYRIKLQASLFQADFECKFIELQQAFDSMSKACRDSLNSPRLRGFMAVVLNVTNFLNRGSHIKVMGGASMESWCSLVETVDNSGTSLLHHVIKHVRASDADLLKFVDDIPTLDKATSYSLEGLKTEVAELNIQLKKFIDTMQRGQTSTRIANEAMIEGVKKSLSILHEQISTLKDLSQDLSIYFVQQEPNFDLQQCLVKLQQFCNLVKQVTKDMDNSSHVEQLARVKLQGLGAQNADKYFADLFTKCDKSEVKEQKEVQRLKLIDVLKDQLHLGHIRPNVLGREADQETELPEYKGSEEATDDDKKADIKTASNEHIDLSDMFQFLEELSPKKAHKEASKDSNCTYHVKSPLAVNLSRSELVTTSCKPAEPDQKNPTHNALDSSGNYDRQITQQNKADEGKENENCPEETSAIAEVTFQIPRQFPIEKYTPDRELSWDGFLPLQYTPGKDVPLPVQSTPAKEGESILVIPDLKPYSKQTFADRADVVIMQQYRKSRQVISSSYLNTDGQHPAASDKTDKDIKTKTTKTRAHRPKNLDILKDESVELEPKAYDRTEDTPYDNVKAEGNIWTEKTLTETKETCQNEEAVPCRDDVIPKSIAPDENKENNSPDCKKAKAKPVSKLGILKRFSKAVMRQKDPVTEKNQTNATQQTMYSNKHTGTFGSKPLETGKFGKSNKVGVDLSMQSKMPKREIKPSKGSSDEPSLKGKRSTTSANDRILKPVNVNTVSNAPRHVERPGLVPADIYTANAEKKAEPFSDEDGFIKPNPVPFKRQNALPVRGKTGNIPALKRIGSRSTLPQSKKEEQVKLGSFKNKDIIMKPSYRTLPNEDTSQPSRASRPASLQLRYQAKPSGVLQSVNIENNDNGIKTTTTRKSLPLPKKRTEESTDRRKHLPKSTNAISVQAPKYDSKPTAPQETVKQTTKDASNPGSSRFGFSRPQVKNSQLGKTEIQAAKTCSLKIYKKY